MATLQTISVNLAKLDKSKFISGEKGTYVNLVLWVNDQEDQYGNRISVQQSLTKEERDAGAKPIYVGNGKVYDKKGGQSPQQASAQAQNVNNDLPF